MAVAVGARVRGGRGGAFLGVVDGWMGGEVGRLEDLMDGDGTGSEVDCGCLRQHARLPIGEGEVSREGRLAEFLPPAPRGPPRTEILFFSAFPRRRGVPVSVTPYALRRRGTQSGTRRTAPQFVRDGAACPTTAGNLG